MCCVTCSCIRNQLRSHVLVYYVHMCTCTRGVWERKATVRGCFFAAASRRSKLACTSPSQSYNKFTKIVSAPFIGNLGMEHTYFYRALVCMCYAGSWLPVACRY
jgi:hypothetical protein